jgi:hypothetical protein
MIAATVISLGRSRATAPILEGSHQLPPGRAPAPLSDVGPAVVEIEQHDHPGLRRDAGEGDEAHGHRDREIVLQEPHRPDATDQRERKRKHDDQHLGDRPEGGGGNGSRNPPRQLEEQPAPLR